MAAQTSAQCQQWILNRKVLFVAPLSEEFDVPNVGLFDVTEKCGAGEARCEPWPSGDVVSASVGLACHEASEMLGIWMAPDGNNKKMLTEMRRAAKIWRARPSEDAFTALQATISAKLKYPLAAWTFTEKECLSIMSPAINA